MFVQIGENAAFQPDTIWHVYFDENNRFVELYTSTGKVLTFYGEDRDAFLDWWTRCATVSRFPNGNSHRTITIEVESGLVQDVLGLPSNWGYQVIDWDVCPKCGGLDPACECNAEEAREQWK